MSSQAFLAISTGAGRSVAEPQGGGGVALGGWGRRAARKWVGSAAADAIHIPAAGFLGQTVSLRSSLRPARPPAGGCCQHLPGLVPTTCRPAGAREARFQGIVFHAFLLALPGSWKLWPRRGSRECPACPAVSPHLPPSEPPSLLVGAARAPRVLSFPFPVTSVVYLILIRPK